MSRVFLCAICNISSGRCNEDCKFCTQSVKYKADIDRYYQKEIDTIIQEAKVARANKAVGFCLVTSTKSLDDKTLEFVSRCAKAVKKEVPDLSLIACNGTADKESLKELTKYGIENYNHNLETSKEYYKNICTTHSWEDRYQTCLNAKEVGLHLVSGGIFGLGESIEDRESMLKSIKELDPMSVPINFYHPNPSLPLPTDSVDVDEALYWVRRAKEILTNSRIMIAGGREITFKDRQKEIFIYGADAIVIGNYLTTDGQSCNSDFDMIKELGLEIVELCHE
jgi:biotin synthase